MVVCIGQPTGGGSFLSTNVRSDCGQVDDLNVEAFDSASSHEGSICVCFMRRLNGVKSTVQY